MESPQFTYIYGLFDPRDGSLRYIGKSNYPKRRLGEHIKSAKRENNQKSYKKSWIRKLLSEGLTPVVEILEEVHIDDWQEAEKAWISDCKEFGLELTNIAEGGMGGLGYFCLTEEQEEKRLAATRALRGSKRTPEQCARMSRAQKGKKLPKEVREKISKANKGRPAHNKGIRVSKETRKRISQALKGRKITEEHRRKNSESKMGKKNPMYGKTHSEETRQKRSQALKGRVITKEHREKLSKALMGHEFSEETKEKISKTLKGRKLSEETRRKMSEAQKRKWEKIKNGQ